MSFNLFEGVVCFDVSFEENTSVDMLSLCCSVIDFTVPGNHAAEADDAYALMNAAA